MRFFPVAVLFLLASSLSGDAARASRDPTNVELVFDWPRGLEASVSSTRTRTRVADERTTHTLRSSYRVIVQREGKNLRIVVGNPQVALEGDRAPMPAATQEQLVSQVADFHPDYIVTRAGEFVGVDDLPAFRARLEKLMSTLVPEDLGSDMLQRLLETVTSEAFLQGQAAQQWNALVGTWAGAEIELGQRLEHSADEPFPLLPGKQIPMNYSFTAKRWVPCRRGKVERRCIELEMRSTADPDAMKQILQTFMSDLASTLEEKELASAALFQTLTVENVVQLVTEPKGLIPHALTITKNVRGTLSVEGEERPLEQTDVHEARYTYQ